MFLSSIFFVIYVHFTIGDLRIKSHPVTTLINAKWKQTPLYFEIGEYLADENPNTYWDFIDALGELDAPLSTLESESKQYIVSMDLVEKLITPMQFSLLKLAVSTHSFTPRIQAQLQIAYNILKRANCKGTILAVIGDDLYCDLSELKNEIGFKSQVDIDFYNFDHIYPESSNSSVPVVLYGDLVSPEFRNFHDFLKKEAILGNIKYILRYCLKIRSRKSVRLSGYGVELHLKSTEYKSQDDQKQGSEKVDVENLYENEIEGFDLNVLKTRFPDLTYSMNNLRTSLLEKSEEISPLKAWEFQDLGLQASQFVANIQGEESLQALQFISQNFPIQAKSLLVQSVSAEFRKEMKQNTDIFARNLNLHPPDATLFVNGIFFDVDILDLFSLIETLRTELKILDGLHKNGIKGNVATSLLALDLSLTSTRDFAIDIRDSAVIWINDIENDQQYRRWPPSVMDLLRPTFPGVVRNIRKNLFNLILVVDPLTPSGRGLIKLAESFVIHLAPIHLGIVFDSRSMMSATTRDYRAIICAFNYIMQNRNARSALSFLTDIFASVKNTDNITYNIIKKHFKNNFKLLRVDDIEDILDEDSEYDYGRHLSLEFVERLGFKESPQILLNGVPFQKTALSPDDFEEVLFTEIIQQTSSIQKSVYRGELTDSDEVIDYLMNQPHVVSRLNHRILSNAEPKFLDMSGTVNNDINNINLLPNLSKRDMIATLAENLKYFTSKNEKNNNLLTTVWVFTDLSREKGCHLLKNALEYMKSSTNLRVAFIPNVGSDQTSKKDNINRVVWAISQSVPSNEAVDIVLNYLNTYENNNFELPNAVKEIIAETELHLNILRLFVQKILNLNSSQSTVVTNGRNYGAFDDDETFTVDDFGLLEKYNNLQYGDKIKKVIESIDDAEDLKISSDIILKVIAMLAQRQQTRSRFTIPKEVKEEYTVVKLPSKAENLPYFDIVAVLDPASRGAQKLSSLLILLRSVINCKMRIFFCAVEHHSDMPIKSFYRFVVDSEVQFSADGKLLPGPFAKFVGLPTSSLLTQNLQIPENWLVEVVQAVYDLDNIKLIDIGGPVHSEYELEYLLLEGHCFDTITGAPPRGLQITLGTAEKPIVVDTIVMANLGYFQLKANPGIWELRLRQGKSAEIYNITSVEGENSIRSNDSIKVAISSLRSHVIKLRVTKKPEMINADLLADDSEQNSGIWSSIAHSFTGGHSDENDDGEINIFSVASGHLYERLLRIMMLSLLRHTNSQVKFWFLKNYLSPQFIELLPHMAKEYNFKYELVQYRWPRWLHQQTEKQRTIWGYKILFLDVLFPLDIKKIIFVDADAIVRADLKELNELDLEGAPYAYTPFCDSRKEMEGFRFWKQGYWKNHLMGRRYHISALYVVDLKRFRRIAAGDRLRGQYQALSQDPNSLSNLDQDLPNNMIHQVAIKSLSDEWLWCETWCSDNFLKKAKVIDLCNNPMTKEAKLTAAQRIVPEWKQYDQEIKNLIAKIEDRQMENNKDMKRHEESVHFEL